MWPSFDFFFVAAALALITLFVPVDFRWEQIAAFVAASTLLLARHIVNRNPAAQEELKRIQDELAGLSSRHAKLVDRVSLVSLKVGLSERKED